MWRQTSIMNIARVLWLVQPEGQIGPIVLGAHQITMATASSQAWGTEREMGWDSERIKVNGRATQQVTASISGGSR